MAEIIRAHDDDWSLVREIRLRSLSTNPEAFGQSWDRESTYEDKVWKKRVREAAWFLAVEDGQPVAVVAAPVIAAPSPSPSLPPSPSPS